MRLRQTFRGTRAGESCAPARGGQGRVECILLCEIPPLRKESEPMKTFFTTWRLSFISLPTGPQLEEASACLAPVARSGKAEDYAWVFREFGLHDFLFVEPEAELTAGELALQCLTKAHRLGKGWSIRWPTAVGEDLWSTALPDCLDGLAGDIGSLPSLIQIHLSGLQHASFSVKVVEQSQVSERPKEPRPTLAPAGPPGPDAIAVVTAFGAMLVRFLSVAWNWEVQGASDQLEGFGFRPSGEEAGYLTFADQRGAGGRIMAESGKILWVEFVLSEFREPHLLDESAFTVKQAEYEQLFLRVVDYARALLGEPAFSGASGDVGFPRDQWADFAAVWPTPSGRLMVQQKHNDKELPLELCLVFAPA